MKKINSLILLIGLVSFAHAQTWVDNLSNFAHEKYLPAQQFKWTWINAPLLRAIVEQYEKGGNQSKYYYLDCVKTAMDNKAKRAQGSRPNTVAPYIMS